MRLIRFLGDGEDDVCNKNLHIEGHDGKDFTLCGLSLDNDTGTVGTNECVKAKKITCPDCKNIIQYCRDISL